MIQAADFRVNNAVYCKYRPGHYLVKEITEDGIRIAEPARGYKFWESYETIIPIELSPEILEACGFEHKGGWMGKKFVTQIYDEETEIVFEVMDNVLVIYANDIRVRKIDNPVLHQIMNCWLEFTGTELSINLEKAKA